MVSLPGEVSEWLKEHAWKVCIRETVSRVRIPLSPPYNFHHILEVVLTLHEAFVGFERRAGGSKWSEVQRSGIHEGFVCVTCAYE